MARDSSRSASFGVLVPSTRHASGGRPRRRAGTVPSGRPCWPTPHPVPRVRVPSVAPSLRLAPLLGLKPPLGFRSSLRPAPPLGSVWGGVGRNGWAYGRMSRDGINGSSAAARAFSSVRPAGMVSRLLCLGRYAGLLPGRVSRLLLLDRCAGLLLLRASRLLGLGRYASLLPGRVSRLFPWAAAPVFCWWGSTGCLAWTATPVFYPVVQGGRHRFQHLSGRKATCTSGVRVFTRLGSCDPNFYPARRAAQACAAAPPSFEKPARQGGACEHADLL